MPFVLGIQQGDNAQTRILALRRHRPAIVAAAKPSPTMAIMPSLPSPLSPTARRGGLGGPRPAPSMSRVDLRDRVVHRAVAPNGANPLPLPQRAEVDGQSSAAQPHHLTHNLASATSAAAAAAAAESCGTIHEARGEGNVDDAAGADSRGAAGVGRVHSVHRVRVPPLPDVVPITAAHRRGSSPSAPSSPRSPPSLGSIDVTVSLHSLHGAVGGAMTLSPRHDALTPGKTHRRAGGVTRGSRAHAGNLHQDAVRSRGSRGGKSSKGAMGKRHRHVGERHGSPRAGMSTPAHQATNRQPLTARVVTVLAFDCDDGAHLGSGGGYHTAR